MTEFDPKKAEDSGYCFTRSSQQSRLACSKSRTAGTQYRLPSACISIRRSSIQPMSIRWFAKVWGYVGHSSQNLK